MKLHKNVKNEIGNRYGRLIVIDFGGKNNQGGIRWVCQCDCGNTVIVNGSELRQGKTKSCGCYRRELAKQNPGPMIIDEIGKRYGRLIVIKYAGGDSNGARWLCRCDCGNEKIIAGTNLRSHGTKSCGCLQLETVKKAKGEYYFNEIYRRFKASAKKRNYEWRLTKEQVKKLVILPCYYCGIAPQQMCNNHNYNGKFLYNGLDRVDNSRGYIIDNVVSCCGNCNFAKKTMSQDEFKNWIIRVYKHFVIDDPRGVLE